MYPSANPDLFGMRKSFAEFGGELGTDNHKIKLEGQGVLLDFDLVNIVFKMNRLLLLIATYFNIGRISKAPGTVATVATIPLWWALAQTGPLIYMIVVVLLIPLGILAAQAYEAQSSEHDSKEIVIDEVVGFLITMVWLPLTWQSLVLGFILFRFLDIVKPPPIRQLDQHVKGGFGVMIDDIAAGLIGSVILQIIFTQTSWLGVQISTLTSN